MYKFAAWVPYLSLGKCQDVHIKVMMSFHLELINKYVTLIDSLEALVIVTAVPYRLSGGSREANMKADILNDYLKSLCYTSDNLAFVY